MGIALKLKNVRMSFPKLWKAEDFQGDQKYRYSAAFLVPKDDTATIKQVDAAIEAVAKDAWPKTWQKEITQLKAQGALKFCWNDGDEKVDAKGEVLDGYAGHMALGANRKQDDGRPAICKRDGSAAEQGGAESPYGGCYVVASVEIYAQSGTQKGIRCGLRGVQFYKDGKPFGGAAPVGDDEFESLADEFEDLV